MTGRHITDQKVPFITIRQANTVPVAAARAGIGQASG
jgi:hypothetical protein